MHSCWTGVLLSSLIIVPALLTQWHELRRIRRKETVALPAIVKSTVAPGKR